MRNIIRILFMCCFAFVFGICSDNAFASGTSGRTPLDAAGKKIYVFGLNVDGEAYYSSFEELSDFFMEDFANASNGDYAIRILDDVSLNADFNAPACMTCIFLEGEVFFSQEGVRYEEYHFIDLNGHFFSASSNVVLNDSAVIVSKIGKGILLAKGDICFNKYRSDANPYVKVYDSTGEEVMSCEDYAWLSNISVSAEGISFRGDAVPAGRFPSFEFANCDFVANRKEEEFSVINDGQLLYSVSDDFVSVNFHTTYENMLLLLADGSLGEVAKRYADRWIEYNIDIEGKGKNIPNEYFNTVYRAGTTPGECLDPLSVTIFNVNTESEKYFWDFFNDFRGYPIQEDFNPYITYYNDPIIDNYFADNTTYYCFETGFIPKIFGSSKSMFCLKALQESGRKKSVNELFSTFFSKYAVSEIGNGNDKGACYSYFNNSDYLGEIGCFYLMNYDYSSGKMTGAGRDSTWIYYPTDNDLESSVPMRELDKATSSTFILADNAPIGCLPQKLPCFSNVNNDDRLYLYDGKDYRLIGNDFSSFGREEEVANDINVYLQGLKEIISDVGMSADFVAAAQMGNRTIRIETTKATFSISGEIINKRIAFQPMVEVLENEKSIEALMEKSGLTHECFEFINVYSDTGEIPGKVNVKVKVSDAFSPGDFVKIFYYNEGVNELEKVSEGSIASDNSFEFFLSHFSKYILIKSEIDDYQPIFESTVEGFVKRMYYYCFSRKADEGGLSFWCEALNSKEDTGASLAKFFCLSEEMENKELSNEEFLYILYRSLMGREPDSNGLNYWMQLANSGVGRQYFVKAFVESEEFRGICDNFGIVCGNVGVNEEYRSIVPQLTQFISRMYTKALARGYDVGGIEYWCKSYVTGEKGIMDICKFFFESEEFLGLKLGNSEYVSRLYFTFFDRNPELDKNGFDYWVEGLNSGEWNRTSEYEYFASSPEFAEIKATYGF